MASTNLNATSQHDSANALTLVLVTGGTFGMGFIGSAVALEFLKQGYSVRLTLGNQSQADPWLLKYPQYTQRLSFAFIESLVAEGTFDEAVKGVTYIAHVASPASALVEDNCRDLLDPAIQGTRSILLSAQKEPKVKSIVITTSVASFIDFAKQSDTYVVDTSSKHPATYESAASLPIERGLETYAASKVLSETLAWDFMLLNKPHFTLTTLGPAWVMGEHPEPTVKSLAELGSSPGATARAVLDCEEVMSTPIHVFVDIRDVALAHVRAVQLPEAAGKRLILSSGSFSLDDVVKFIAQEYPDQAGRVAKWREGVSPKPYRVDGSEAEAVLGFRYIGFEDSVRSFADQVLALPATA